MRCEQCSKEFKATEPARTEQRFCSDSCRKRWHYLETKRERYAADVTAHEARLNGHSAPSEQKIDLAALRLLPQRTFTRRI
jgi:hypothetical protein